MTEGFEILEVLHSWDGTPMFFVGKTTREQTFMGYFIESLNGQSTWVVGSFKQTDLDAVKNLTMDLRTFILSSTNKQFYTYIHKEQTDHLKPVLDSELLELIPDSGVFL